MQLQPRIGHRVFQQHLTTRPLLSCQTPYFQNQSSPPQATANTPSENPSPQERLDNEVKRYLQAFSQYAPPAFNPAFHKERRATLISQLPPNSVMVIVGGEELRRNHDVNYPFRQQNNFYYLTGFDEPNAVAILSNIPNRPQFTLLVQPKNPNQEMWTGRRAGTEGAKVTYGADAAYTIDSLFSIIGQELVGSENAFMAGADSVDPNTELVGSMNERTKAIADFIKTPRLPYGKKLEDGSQLIYEMRSVKTPYEIALLKRACAITALAHEKTIRTQKVTQKQMQEVPFRQAGRNEGEIQAMVEYHFRRHGAIRVGYSSISGAGGNGCVLHYVNNNTFAKPGDLVLLDAGAEYGHYTADVTRTWPVSGKFTPEQKAIYTIVLKAQEAGIQAVRPGTTLAQVHAKSARVVTEGLVSIGLLKGDVDKLFAEKAYERYFPHGTSHFLGMDVHDTSGKNFSREKGKFRPLVAGMALTVEPGLYIDPEKAKQDGIDPKWWNIAVRIEDDILVTPTGYENLSAGAPKSVESLEAMMMTVPKRG